MTGYRINFTKAEIAKIPRPSPGKRLRYYDTKTIGLLIDVTSNGVHTFYVRRKIKGVSDWERLGRYPELSIEQARGLAAKINSQIAEGKNPRDARLAASGELTLGELFNEYIKRHAEKSRKTAAVMRKDFDRTLSQLKDRRLSTITNTDIHNLHQELAERRGPYTANRTIQLLRAVYNKGITWKLTKENPASGITLFKEESRERFLSAAEMTRLFTALGTESEPDTRDFVLLCIFTGARKSNILAMKWEEIDLKKGIWTIPETKNGSSQTIGLTNKEILILQVRLANRSDDNESEFVFPGKGVTGHLVDPKKSWASLLKRAEIADCTIHDLRRTCASWMAGQNVNLAIIKDAMNHKDMKTTMNVYARIAKDAVLQARELTQSAMLKAGGVIPPQDSETDLQAASSTAAAE